MTPKMSTDFCFSKAFCDLSPICESYSPIHLESDQVPPLDPDQSAWRIPKILKKRAVSLRSSLNLKFMDIFFRILLRES